MCIDVERVEGCDLRIYIYIGSLRKPLPRVDVLLGVTLFSTENRKKEMVLGSPLSALAEIAMSSLICQHQG